jgi:hypothetical protein
MAPQNKASLLRFSIAYALQGIKVQVGSRFVKVGLTDEQRHEVAAKVVNHMRDYSVWKDFDTEIEMYVAPGQRVVAAEVDNSTGERCSVGFQSPPLADESF